MSLNLGALVKEYAVDRIALLLRRQGFHSGYVDLGGDLHFIGPHPDGRPWQVGIRHPRAKGAVAAIGVSTGGLATSGDYERFKRHAGRRYSHILDARNGWPVAGLASISVRAPSCLLAGAVSTLAMLLGKQDGLDFLADSGLCWLAHDGDNVFSNIPLKGGECGQPQAVCNSLRVPM
jgi:thiamine biosynthesis lipoprotein